MRHAIQVARYLQVPLIVAGDLHDTKALLRAECVNAMIETFTQAKLRRVPVHIIVGNHDLINEKGSSHALNFLEDVGAVVIGQRDSSRSLRNLELIPYHNDLDALRTLVGHIPSTVHLIMHQGLRGANMGAYAVDNSSLTPEDFAGRRVISGHYHMAQDIPLPDGGLWTYIGSPYTITFAEANDGPKGFRVLYNDGSLDLVPTKLRKHVVAERTPETVLDPIPNLKPNDLLWLKVKGSQKALQALSKDTIGATHLGHSNFKLDKIPDALETTSEAAPTVQLTDTQALDNLIDGTNADVETKQRLKALAKELM